MSGILAAVLFYCHFAFSAQDFSLDEIYQIALEKNESLATQKELIQQAEENYRQAVGSLLPSLSGGFNQTFQSSISNPLAAQFYPTQQTTLKLMAVQPLFRGLREFSGLRQRKSLLEFQVEAKSRIATQLYQEVSQSFHNVLMINSDLVNYKNEIQINQKRYSELKSFTKLGRNREADVLAVESNIAKLEAQVYTLEGQLQNARETLAYLTGASSDVRLRDSEKVPEKIDPIEFYLEQIENRPDIHAARKELDATEESMNIAWGAHLPSVDLVGNYYFIRPGILSDVRWDIQVAATIPIFSGGVTQSQVRQASSERQAKELNLNRLRRQAQQEIRTLYAAFVSDRGQIDRLTLAAKIMDRSAELEQKDFRLGLATNIEVLQSIDIAQQTHRALDRVLIASKHDFSRLEAAAARRPKTK